MKTILTSIALLLAVSSAQLFAQRGFEKQLDVVSYHWGSVPAGKTYFVYDGKGKRIAEFRSGQKTNMTTDCVMIKCPRTFGPDVVCWKCMGFTAQPPGQQKDVVVDELTASTHTIVFASGSEVPKGKTYVVYDAKGKKVGEFRSGQKTPKATNCAMIKCPSTFGKDVVCWQCMGFAAR